MKIPVWIVLTCVIGIVGLLAWQSLRTIEPDDAALSRTARIAEQQETIGRLNEIVDGLEVAAEQQRQELAAAHEETAAVVARASAERERLQVRAAEAGAALQATFDSLRASVQPAIVPLVDVAAQQAADQLEPLVLEIQEVERVSLQRERELRESEALHIVKDLRIVELESLVAEHEAKDVDQDAQIAYWRSEAQPGFLTRLWRAKGEITVGALVGTIVTLAVTR